MNKNRIKNAMWEKVPGLTMILLCIKNCRNQDYINAVKSIYSNGSLQFVRYGNSNPDKDIYLIRLRAETLGFFAAVHHVLRLTYFADRFNLIPVIQFTGKQFYLNADSNYDNFLEQYFFPISDISLNEAKSSYSVMLSQFKRDGTDRIGASIQQAYLRDETEIQLLACQWNKYMKLLPDLQKEVDETITQILNGKKTLGVHMRGCLFRRCFQRTDVAKDHPLAITAEQTFAAVRKALAEQPFEQIFLATDDAEYCNRFREEFSGMVVCFDEAERGEGIVEIFSQGIAVHSPYDLGKEVLLDVLTLATCDGLIAGLSQVSLSARIINQASGNPYSYLDILYNGMND